MGANAQTTVQKFVDGAVLTAEQQNTSAATGVPVFATTVTRDAAFGGANKVLAEGQTCYLESTNVVQFYDGAAWATVGPTAAPTSGLVVVKAETAFGPTGSFIADSVFTSAYTNYLVFIRHIASVVNNTVFNLRSGGVNATTNYNSQFLYANNTTITASQLLAVSSAYFAQGDVTYAHAELILSGPALAERTSWRSVTNNGVSGTAPLLRDSSGNHSTASSFDGIQISVIGGTFTGVYSIYGFGKTL